MLHDTHCHLDMLIEKSGEIPALNSHKWAIHPTVSTENLESVCELFYKNPKVYFLLGAHPEIVDIKFDLEKYMKNVESTLPKLYEKYPDLKTRLIGVGEIGLDHFYTDDQSIWDTQIELFKAHVELATSMKLPIQIHTREAWADTFKVLDDYPEIWGKFLIHCFTGNTENLKGCLDRGGLVAFGGIVTFPKSMELQDAAKYCPLESFVLETDLPFLAPVSYRGKICLPEMIQNTAEVVANLKNIRVEEVWERSEDNAINFFDIA